MKDYSEMYLQEIHRGRENIKDLKCVEEVTFSNYEECFKTVFDKSEQEFQNEVESAISCTNIANKQCSKAAKTSLNRMVRTILGIENPAEEDIEEEIKPTPPPMKWYDYILQPFIYIWNGIKSLFGW
ncbi:uncharacterized protein LOC118205792 [Stegodyphus dumicola]|uniref:uncharacterized protein LOC118205792 n=1 Tax=Stegodyphus dumicola TaxID=202533 RepID=UPI0015AD1EEF|nr:uncharacterized protein LOC118205792 [Stegodyphus dumicola]